MISNNNYQQTIYSSPPHSSSIPSIPSSSSSITLPTPLPSDNQPSFCQKSCISYFCGCNLFIILGLLFSLLFIVFVPPLGLLFSALTPGCVILYLCYYHYHQQITIGQMAVSFFETIMWMIPLIIWDLIWILGIEPHLRNNGLCGLCILAYLLQCYFFAGFCEEVVKFKVISRLSDSQLTVDWRSMMIYGICAGCGFALAENILYVFSYGYVTAIVRSFTSVPLHCCTGAIIGLQISRHKPLSSSCIPLTKVIGSVLFIPWLVHGSYDFFLTLSPNINNSSASVFVAIIAFGFYLFGLIYVRLLSLKVWREDSQCGQGVSIDIHQKITYPQAPLIGQEGIHQWGNSTNYVCSCCFACQCCCKPNHRPRFVDGSSAGISFTDTYAPQQLNRPVQPDEIYVYA